MKEVKHISPTPWILMVLFLFISFGAYITTNGNSFKQSPEVALNKKIISSPVSESQFLFEENEAEKNTEDFSLDNHHKEAYSLIHTTDASLALQSPQLSGAYNITHSFEKNPGIPLYLVKRTLLI